MSRVQQVPRDPGFEARVRASFETQRFMTHLGARIAAIAPGIVEIELPVADELSQQHGFLHAGALLATLDSACGYAALTLMPAGAEVLTVELKTNLLAPARTGTVKARGEVLRPGRTLSVCRGDAFEVVGDTTTHVATMLATIIAREEQASATARGTPAGALQV